MRISTAAFGLVCAGVIAVFFVSAGVGGSEWGGAEPSGLYYDALARGFSAGQLALKKEAPPGLARLPDPYDPAANAPYLYAPYQLNDLSYFRGRFYLYFGVTPALLAFWPWFAVTGQDLPHKYAAAFFCSAGFLAAAGLLRALWRRYFPEVSGWVVAAGALALGLGTTVVVMLQRPGVSEVPIGCAYAFLMLALAALWRALHDPGRAARWLAAAAGAYGLALGARPSELPGAAILLVPLLLAGRGAERRRWLAAVALPLAAAGAGILLHNQLRFGDPFEFGQRYQLAAQRQDGIRHFSLAYLAYNFRLYFLAPTAWGRFFPFIQGTMVPPPPPGHAAPENVISILPNLPLVLLALATPLAWLRRPPGETRTLREFLTAVGLLPVLLLTPLLFYYWASNRYEVEFLPPLLLLALVGILGLERSLAGRGAWLAAARAGWLALLCFSVGFNVLASCGRYAAERYSAGLSLDEAGRPAEALGQYQAAVRMAPSDFRMRNDLGIALARQRRLPEAREQFEAAVRLRPDLTEGHANLGNAFLLLGRLPEAITQYEAALRLTPDDAALGSRLAAARRALASPR